MSIYPMPLCLIPCALFSISFQLYFKSNTLVSYSVGKGTGTENKVDIPLREIVLSEVLYPVPLYPVILFALFRVMSTLF